MLHKCSVLNFYVRAGKQFSFFRVYIVLIDIMNPTVFGRLPIFYIIIFVYFVAAFVLKTSLMENRPKFI